MKVWTRPELAQSGSEYELVRLGDSRVKVTKTGGQVHPVPRVKVHDTFYGDEVVVAMGRPLILKKSGREILRTSPVRAIFR